MVVYMCMVQHGDVYTPYSEAFGDGTITQA
jgi:hypothetical protein